jgi:hypothetical protein
MAVGKSFQQFLSLPDLPDRLASNNKFRNCYDTVAQIAAEHSQAPLVLREGEDSTRHILDIIRSSEGGYAFLQFPSSLLVDILPEDCCIGDNFGVQLINPKTALASWMDSEPSVAMKAGEARKMGERLDSLIASVHRQVQDIWGLPLELSCFIEALRYQLHSFTSKKLETAYFHSIELSDRANGPTLVQQRLPR